MNLSSEHRSLLNQLYRFSVVGCAGVFVNMGVLILLKDFCGFLLPLASLIAIELSILNNFLFNEKWTFKKQTLHPELITWKNRLVLFQVVSMVGAGMNFATLNALTMSMGMDYRVANVIGIIIAFGWNFTLNKNITWRETYEV